MTSARNIDLVVIEPTEGGEEKVSPGRWSICQHVNDEFVPFKDGKTRVQSRQAREGENHERLTFS